MDRLNEGPIISLINMIHDITGMLFENENFIIAKNKIISRMNDLEFERADDYFDFFRRNKEQELKMLISILTNHTTEFFRETIHFDFLADQFFPKFVKDKKPIRIWSAAASTGKEALSIVICYFETLDRMGIEEGDYPPLELLATDIDADSIEKCRNGIYLKKNVVGQMSPSLVRKYFDVGSGDLSAYVRIKEKIHSKCQFGVFNLLSESVDDVGFFDVIFIRNVLIYFKPDDVRKIISNIQAHLKPKGYLILGLSESLATYDVPFSLLNNSIYTLKTEVAEMKYKPTYTITKEKIKYKNFVNVGLILIGSSTGGTEALKIILNRLDKETPPILIVQHLPEDFSSVLVAQLNELSSLEVFEGRTGQILKKGCVYLAPGGKQMGVVLKEAKSQLENESELMIEINDEPKMNMHKPSVDYTFLSVAKLSKKMKLCSVILTGMGDDGARGMKALYDKDAFTVAQDEESSVVFGMPKAAMALGAVHEVAPLSEIPNILKYISAKKSLHDS